MADSVYEIKNFNSDYDLPNFYRDPSGTLNSLEKIIQSSNFNGSIPTVTASIGITQIIAGSYLFVEEDEIYPIVNVLVDAQDSGDVYYLNYIKDNEIVTETYSSSTASPVIIYEDWDAKNTGTNGWLITQQGNAIFSNVAVRGDLEATTLDVGGANGIIYNGSAVTIGTAVTINAPVTVNSLEVGTAPNILKISASPNGVYGQDGIYINDYNYWYTNGDFGFGGAGASAKWISSASTLSIRGNIIATSGSFTGALAASVGKIGGFTLNNDALLATNIILSSSGGLRLGPSNQIILTQAGAFTASTASIGGDSTINGTNIGNGGGNIASNLRVGTLALESNTSGSFNLALGDYALRNNTTGKNNIGIGASALFNNTNMDQNIAIGKNAMSGSANMGQTYSNIAIGESSLFSVRDSIYNVAIGASAMFKAQNDTNVAIGYRSMGNASFPSFSVAVGRESLYSNTNGFANVALGDTTLYSNTSGIYNVAAGVNSLYSNTSGFYNSGLGTDTLRFNTIGYYNTAAGTFALRSNTSGVSNTAFGVNSLYSNTSGYFNTGIGYNALYSNTTGDANIALGSFTLTTNTTGVYNTAVGYNALNSNIDGDVNIAIGFYPLYSNTSGNSNIAIGRSPLYSNTSGFFNSAIGASALYFNTSGIYNTALGWRTLTSNTTGDYNIALGYQAGEGQTSGNTNANMYLGYAGPTATTSSIIYIGTLNTLKLKIGADSSASFYNDFNVDAGTFYVDAGSNRVGILTTSPDRALTVAGAVKASNGIIIGTAGTATGETTVISSVGVFSASGSDTAAIPGYTWSNDPDTGLYRAAANQLGLTTNGVSKGIIGNGTSSFLSNDVQVIGNNIEFGVQDAAGNFTLRAITADGVTASVGTLRSRAVYDRITSNTPNQFINTTFIFTRTTASSKKWKNSIKDIDSSRAIESISKIRPVEFIFNEGYLSDDDSRIGLFVPGFIAEEINEVDSIIADKENNEPIDWNPRIMIPLMVKVIQEQQKNINELYARISQLEAGNE